MILFDFFRKQKKLEEKARVSRILINTLEIPEEQKQLYLDALDILWEKELEDFYNNLTNFIKNIELKELEDIKKSNFTNIAWMQKKEAQKQKKELNAFSLLLNNV